MLQMGRPRTKHKDMPPGMQMVAGRWYWRPTDAATRAVRDVIALGKSSVPAGSDKDAARRWWVANVLRRIESQDVAADDCSVASIIDAYLGSQKFHDLADKTRKDYARDLATLREKFGGMSFATSDADAAKGDKFRRMHVAAHLDDATKKTAANRQAACLSSAFKLAIRQGRTEYNPCQGVERNTERPRTRLVTHSEYAKLKHAAPPVIRIAMLLAKLTGMREGDLLRLSERQIVNGEILVTPSKTKNTSGISQRIKVTKTVQTVLNAAKSLRGNLRSMYVIHTRTGQAYTQSGFQSMWQRVVKASGVEDVHFHDLKARAVTDSERKRPGSGSDLAGHVDPKTTRKTYRRGAVKVLPVK